MKKSLSVSLVLKMLQLKDSGSMWSSSGAYTNNTTSDYEENLTLSCAAMNIQGPVMLPYSDLLLTIVRVFQSLFWISLFLGGMFLNVFVIFLVAKYKRLQVLSFGLAVQIIAQDLLITFILSSGLVSSIANQWILGEHMCAFVGSILLTSATVRTLILFVFIVDRFFSVFSPFHYPKYQVKVVIILSTTVWLFAGLVGIMGYILDCYIFNIRTWICFYSSTCNIGCFRFFSLYNGLQIILGTVVPIILYTILFIKAKKAKKAMAVHIQSVKSENDWKATITFFLLFLTVFVLIAPNVLVLSVTNAAFQGKTVPPGLYVITIITASMNSLLVVTDPILIMRNKDVREVKKELILKIIRKFQKQNNSTINRSKKDTTMESML